MPVKINKRVMRLRERASFADSAYDAGFMHGQSRMIAAIHSALGKVTINHAPHRADGSKKP